ncbi:MAG: cupredoxin domain-containing protein [Ilumatobacteraceae bacterium]
MTRPAVTRRVIGLGIAGVLIFAPVLAQNAAAVSPLIKEGDKCTKVGLKTRGNSGVILTCTRVGTTKVLTWKRTVTKPATTTTTIPAVTTASQISIKNLTFTVAGNVKSTDVLSVTNRDGFTHTVTSDSGAFDVTVEGGTKEKLPTLSPGTYAFHCNIHTSMHGTLVVG